jgi:hypothetical protein
MLSTPHAAPRHPCARCGCRAPRVRPEVHPPTWALQVSLMMDNGDTRDDLALPFGTEDFVALAKDLQIDFEAGREILVTVTKVRGGGGRRGGNEPDGAPPHRALAAPERASDARCGWHGPCT